MHSLACGDRTFPVLQKHPDLHDVAGQGVPKVSQDFWQPHAKNSSNLGHFNPDFPLSDPLKGFTSKAKSNTSFSFTLSLVTLRKTSSGTSKSSFWARLAAFPLVTSTNMAHNNMTRHHLFPNIFRPSDKRRLNGQQWVLPIYTIHPHLNAAKSSSPNEPVLTRRK